MSGRCTGWVLKHGPRDRAMRAVLITIADAANADGEHAHPGIEAMVEGSLYSRATINRVVRQLIADDWLEVEKKGGGRGLATVYRVVMPAEEKRAQDDAVTEKPRHLESETASSDPETASLPYLENSPTVLVTVNPNQPATDEPSRAPDPIWDTFVAVFGEAPETKNERGRWNNAARQLREINASPEQIWARASRWPDLFPGARLTPLALVSNWSLIGQALTSSAPVLCPKCLDPLGAAHTDYHCQVQQRYLATVEADSA